jgi:hypothetical protein
MASYDDEMRRVFELQRYQQAALGMGMLGNGIGYGAIAQGMNEAKKLNPTEPEFNPVLLLGDEDEA